MKYIFIILMIILLPFGYLIYKISNDKEVEVVKTKTHITAIKSENTIYVAHINVDSFINLGDMIYGEDTSITSLIPYRVDAGYDLDEMEFVFKTNAKDSIVRVNDISMLNTNKYSDLRCEITLPEIKIKVNTSGETLTIYEGKESNKTENMYKKYKIFSEKHYAKTIAKKKNIEEKAQKNIEEFFNNIGKHNGVTYSISNNSFKSTKENERLSNHDFPITIPKEKFKLGYYDFPCNNSKGDSLKRWVVYNEKIQGQFFRIALSDKIENHTQQIIKQVLLYSNDKKIKISPIISGEEINFLINVSGISYQLNFSGDDVFNEIPNILDLVYSFKYNEDYEKKYNEEYLGITKDMMETSTATGIAKTLKKNTYFYSFTNYYEKSKDRIIPIYDTSNDYIVLLKDHEVNLRFIESEINDIKELAYEDKEIRLDEAIALLIDYDRFSRNQYYIFSKIGLYTFNSSGESEFHKYETLNSKDAATLLKEDEQKNMEELFEWLRTQGFIGLF